ncbi:hypothetical protein SANTM175S_02778 [Streptomyces antimycoticus]
MTPASSGPATGPRKRGRPARTSASDGPGARDRILAAARNEFAERGYDKTSIRGIAKAAEVDPALVHHYFGTKEQVFEAAIELIFAPAMAAPDAVHGSRRARASGWPALCSASGRTRSAGCRCSP